MKSLFGVVSAALILVLAAPASAESPVPFAEAKRELATYARFTCPEPGCRHRIHDCARRSPSRVVCESEIRMRREGVVQPENRFVIERETCRWLGIAEPYEGGEGLKVTAAHFRCRTVRSWPGGDHPQAPLG